MIHLLKFIYIKFFYYAFFILINIAFATQTSNNELENILFNSIKGDSYNLTFIYHYNYDNIKIKHLTKNTENKIICIFGVLVNLKGMIIENEMLNWLLPEYDIYCVYQKYPGILFEYPYFRFGQWILEKSNKTILLYVHTKGAFHSFPGQEKVRKIWMNEFIKPRNKIYIQPILKNKTDICAPFRAGVCTWFNGMYISKRAFDLISEVPKKKRRHYYEGGIFLHKNMRIKGIIKDRILPSELGKEINYNLVFQNKKNKIVTMIEEILLLGFIIIIKLCINSCFKFIKFTKKKIPIKNKNSKNNFY